MRLLPLPHQSILPLDWIISVISKHLIWKIRSGHRFSKIKIFQKINYTILLNYSIHIILNIILKIRRKNTDFWFVKCVINLFVSSTLVIDHIALDWKNCFGYWPKDVINIAQYPEVNIQDKNFQFSNSCAKILQLGTWNEMLNARFKLNERSKKGENMFPIEFLLVAEVFSILRNVQFGFF